MGRYLIQDTESKAIKKSLIKWGEFPVSNGALNGIIIIKNYRKYPHRHEVDIEFKGEIFVRIYNENRTWHTSDVLNDKKFRISKVKLNRYLRRNSLNDVQMRMRYFGVNVSDYQYISKVKWL